MYKLYHNLCINAFLSKSHFHLEYEEKIIFSNIWRKHALIENVSCQNLFGMKMYWCTKSYKIYSCTKTGNKKAILPKNMTKNLYTQNLIQEHLFAQNLSKKHLYITLMNKSNLFILNLFQMWQKETFFLKIWRKRNILKINGNKNLCPKETKFWSVSEEITKHFCPKYYEKYFCTNTAKKYFCRKCEVKCIYLQTNEKEHLMKRAFYVKSDEKLTFLSQIW